MILPQLIVKIIKYLGGFFFSSIIPAFLFAQNISGLWSTESSVGFTPRALLTSCVVEGKIYAIGGYNDTGYLNTVEVFDPKPNQWNTPPTTGTFTARRGMTSAVVGGKIYVMGGYDGKNWLNTLEVFDPSKREWSTPFTTGTFTAREKLCSSVVDGKIYAMGGYNGTDHLNTLEVFDPSSNEWSTPTTSGTFTARRGLSSAVVSGKIYVMGGFNGGTSYLNTLEVYDPVTKLWNTPNTTGTFTERGAFTSAVIAGTIYAIGGIHYVAGNFIPVTTLVVFNPVNNSWSTPQTTGTFTERFELTSALGDDKIYVIGGKDVGYLNTNEIFAPLINDVKINDVGNIQLSPNPTTNSVLVSGLEKVSHISLLNILGNSVMEFQSPFAPEQRIDLSKFAKGTYYIRCVSGKSIITTMVVRE